MKDTVGQSHAQLAPWSWRLGLRSSGAGRETSNQLTRTAPHTTLLPSPPAGTVLVPRSFGVPTAAEWLQSLSCRLRPQAERPFWEPSWDHIRLHGATEACPAEHGPPGRLCLHQSWSGPGGFCGIGACGQGRSVTRGRLARAPVSCLPLFSRRDKISDQPCPGRNNSIYISSLVI